jgi:tetraacyldisaccharide 4'-kinase
MMRAPGFWQHRGIAAQVLRPLGALTAQITARRVARAGGLALDIPVICVGNIHAGGTGKTPMVMALAGLLQASGLRMVIVTRGYGGRMDGPLLVDPSRHSAQDVGDEPLLLAAFAPVVVARDRAAGAALALAQGAGVIVLDDGMQNPALRKDLTLLVVDAQMGFGNGLCLPAGPLREPLAAGLLRTDLVVSIGLPAAQAQFDARYGRALGDVPRLRGQLRPLATGMAWQGARVVVFAGIGRPEKFFATLRDLGAEVLQAEALPDHAPLPEALIARLLARARALGADLVTTEKDAIRLPPRYRADVISLPVRLQIDDETPLRQALHRLGLNLG